MYALCDCNNFFVSCERVFRPDLEGKPVVVLSGNDGCVVSRSNEAKKLGIKMGTPFFQMEALAKKEGVTAFSSNFSLYGDLSSRVMSILAKHTPRLEQYSIDEAFLHCDHMPVHELKPYYEQVVKQIRKWVGIPVSIGLAPTKTLAKIASKYAKQYPAYNGVCIIDTDEKVAIIQMLINGTLIKPVPHGAQPLSSMHINAELLYNSIPFSKILFMANLTMGFILMFFTLYIKKAVAIVRIISSITLYLSTAFLLSAFLLRWYISQTIPLTNGYETMVFVALATLLIALFLHRRISIIAPTGAVVYDNMIPLDMLDNHLSRPEVAKAMKHGTGYHIGRQSSSDGKEYFYSATKGERAIVRTAIPYSSSLRELLEADWDFLGFMISISLMIKMFRL